MSTDAQVSDRAIRQRDLVPPARLAACRALVIGVGAIGRQVALQLAALGVPRLTLCDNDVVSIENLAPQGYCPADLQVQKVVATRSACLQMHPEMAIEVVPERFRRSLAARMAREDTPAARLKRSVFETCGQSCSGVACSSRIQS